jgi:hypothetical protein
MRSNQPGQATPRAGALARRLATALSFVTVLCAGAVRAQSDLPVFDGDAIDPVTGIPHSIVPGLPLFLPGVDEEYGTGDDVIDATKVGDVDVVIRTKNQLMGGAIPVPAAGVADAPPVVAGGQQTGAGTEAVFQVILSDGDASADQPAGHPLRGSAHNGRGVLVVAYPDLDGDGILGPTNDDAAGSADNEIERQETLSFAGRQVGVVMHGVADGTIGVTLGAPASGGGLGIVLVGGAIMGVTASEHFFDGPWITTLTPYMLPVDPREVIGNGNVRPPDPENLVEIELEGERFGRLAPDHPLLGTPFAIPLDGSSITVDLLRGVGGAQAGVNIAVPVDPATFVASSARRVLAAVGANGARRVVEDAATIEMADDGPGSRRTIVVFAADLLGNPTDPAAPTSVTVEVSAGLAITAPNGDGDPSRETVVVGTVAAVDLILDDAGTAGDGGAGGTVTALVNGLPADTLRVTFGGVPPPTTTTTGTVPTSTTAPTSTTTSSTVVVSTTTTTTASSTTATLASTTTTTTGGGTTTTTLLTVQSTLFSFGRQAGEDTLNTAATIRVNLDSFDPTTQLVTLRVADAGGMPYVLEIPVGGFVRRGSSYRFEDDRRVATNRVTRFSFRPTSKGASTFGVEVNVDRLDLAAFEAPPPAMVTQTLSVGAALYVAPLDCAFDQRASALVCVP